MTEILPILEEDFSLEDVHQGDSDAACAAVKARCDARGIPYEDVENFMIDGPAIRIGFPRARDKHWVDLWDFDGFSSLLGIRFEDFVFLQDLEAMCDYGSGTIEARLRPLGPASIRLIAQKLFKAAVSSGTDFSKIPSLNVASPDGKIEASIGPASKEHLTLINGPRQRLSLKIKCADLKHHDQAVEIVRRLADALLFQVDALHDVALGLARSANHLRRFPRARLEVPPPLAFPVHEYDPAPISLYWYGRSAIGMPLLQFLAFYQVVEYYFPIYSQAEAQRKVRSILKDPGFRGERDADVGRLLSAVHVTRSGSFGDERSQLKATIVECVDADELRRFIQDDKDRVQVLSSKMPKLCDHKIPVASELIDLRNDAAERIYQIRCKIVHTKTDARHSEFELLLPFSKEAEQLTHDIELMHFVAQRVLISGSTPFRY